MREGWSNGLHPECVQDLMEMDPFRQLRWCREER